MVGIKDDDGLLYYIVKMENLDATQAAALGLKKAYFCYFYKPSQWKYFMKLYGNDGGESPRIYFDPYYEDNIKLLEQREYVK